jgi:hypothetical protein
LTPAPEQPDTPIAPQPTIATEDNPQQTLPTQTEPPFVTYPSPTIPTAQPLTQAPIIPPTENVPYMDSLSGVHYAPDSSLTFSAVLAGLMIGGCAVILYLKKRNT